MPLVGLVDKEFKHLKRRQNQDSPMCFQWKNLPTLLLYLSNLLAITQLLVAMEPWLLWAVVVALLMVVVVDLRVLIKGNNSWQCFKRQAILKILQVALP